MKKFELLALSMLVDGGIIVLLNSFFDGGIIVL